MELKLAAELAKREAEQAEVARLKSQKEQQDRIDAERALAEAIAKKENDKRIKELEQKFAKEKREADQAAAMA